jgi:hypothetical protein
MEQIMADAATPAADDPTLRLVGLIGGKVKALGLPSVLQEECGMCKRCCLRFAGVRNPTAFNTDESTLEAAWEQLFEVSVKCEPPCRVCLGSLQVAAAADCRAQMVVTTSASPLSASMGDFNVSIALPAIQLVREQGALHFLRQKGCNAAEVAFDVKDALRAILISQVAETVKKPHAAQSNVNVMFTFDHAETSNEHAWVMRETPGAFRAKVRLVVYAQTRHLFINRLTIPATFV